MMRSVLAQLDFKYRIDKWVKEGVPFNKHLYVPEEHPITGFGFCEREDEGHVMKVSYMFLVYKHNLVCPQRLGNCLRLGGPQGVQLQRFVEALYDEKSGLTYPALTGIRKQSVEDLERLFGEGVVKFMQDKGYEVEAKFVRIVHNWRRAVDERGLTTQQRLQYRQDFLAFILDDLMPWHSNKDLNDFSLLEVNRCSIIMM